jgi:plasmid maintenance system antidote protein VapI
MNFALLFLIVSLIFAGAVAYYFSVVRREVREEHKLEIEEKKMHEEEITKDEARVKEELADAHRRATAILAQSEKIAHDLIFELEQVLGKKGIDTTLAIQPATDFEIELGTLSEKNKSSVCVSDQRAFGVIRQISGRPSSKVTSFC